MELIQPFIGKDKEFLYFVSDAVDASLGYAFDDALHWLRQRLRGSNRRSGDCIQQPPKERGCGLLSTKNWYNFKMLIVNLTQAQQDSPDTILRVD